MLTSPHLRVIRERGAREKNGKKKKFEETYRAGAWTSRTKGVWVKERRFS